MRQYLILHPVSCPASSFDLRRLSGFTLIEMVVVIAIIGILAAIALPSVYENAIRKQVKEGMTLADLGKQGVNSYYTLSGEMAQNNEKAGIPEAKKIVSNYISELNVTDGAVTLTFGNNTNRQLTGKRLTIRPAVVKDAPQVPIAWVCAFKPVPKGMTESGPNLTDIPLSWLPYECRG